MFRSCSGLYMTTKRWGFHDGCDEEDKAELRKTVRIKIQESLKSYTITSILHNLWTMVTIEQSMAHRLWLCRPFIFYQCFVEHRLQIIRRLHLYSQSVADNFKIFQKQKLEQKAKNDTMNNPAHYNNFPGFKLKHYVLI